MMKKFFREMTKMGLNLNFFYINTSFQNYSLHKIMKIKPRSSLLILQQLTYKAIPNIIISSFAYAIFIGIFNIKF